MNYPQLRIGMRIRTEHGLGTVAGFERFRKADNKYKEEAYCESDPRKFIELLPRFYDEWDWGVIVLLVDLDEIPLYFKSNRLAYSRLDKVEEVKGE